MSLADVLDLLVVLVILGVVVAAILLYEVAPDSAFEPDDAGRPYDWERDGG